MEIHPTSPEVTNDPRTEAKFPNRLILSVSFILVIIGIIGIKSSDPRTYTFTFGLCIGIFIISLFPWIIVIRRRIWSRRYPLGGKWLTTVKALLWASLLLELVATGSLLLLWKQHSSELKGGGFDPLANFILTLIIGEFSTCAAFILAALAFMIQVWRDQWHSKLTGVTIVYVFLLYITYVWAMSP